jgi:hypothetical protein
MSCCITTVAPYCIKNNAVSINLSEEDGVQAEKNKAPQREPENDVRLSSEYNTGDFIEL